MRLTWGNHCQRMLLKPIDYWIFNKVMFK